MYLNSSTKCFFQGSQPAIGSLWDNKNWYLDGPLISIGELASHWFEIGKAIWKLYIDCFDIKLTTHIRFYDHFWPFFWHMYGHLSQNWGSDGHFEVLNGSESWVLKIWQLISIWASKTHFGKTTLKLCIFKHEKNCFFTNMALTDLCSYKM